MLDTGLPGKLAQRTPPPDISNWYGRVLLAGVQLIAPEIADYEVRREMIRAGMVRSLRVLDRLKVDHAYAPINTTVMLNAARLWAEARQIDR